ncbi:unnamed protein product [Nezara viridula]|uniref:Epoxide hydrolase n=1 Tax=Nezara viridula TaxID=85310 RepID=A0A9P0H7P6_NEZVI|nr:unnamed protein product [Nezara viridula]CAH1396976.1 unnamed protein product [Nezara viridula]
MCGNYFYPIKVTFTLILLLFLQWKFAAFRKPEVKFKQFNLEKNDDYIINPFRINIPESDLIELQKKLLTTRELPPSIKDVGFNYGANSEYLNKFIEYWKNEYNWRDRERYLNQLPQYITRISGLNIHFIRVRPNETVAKGKTIIPILLIHGWLGSVSSFYKLILQLVKPKESYDFVFEVIAPSIPGSGFSEAPQIPGLDPVHVASIFHRLMYLVGHEKYYIHAADLGAHIGQAQALLYPEWIKGYHSNICITGGLVPIVAWYMAIEFPSLFVEEERVNNILEGAGESAQEASYFMLNVNNPDSIGIGLTDSPAGFAAMMIDRIATLSNYGMKNRSDGGLESFDKNELLDTIMTYWLTKSITPSVRWWKETFLLKDTAYMKGTITWRNVEIPSSCSWFKREPAFLPRFALQYAFDYLVSIRYHDEGGRYPAITHPHLLADDLWLFANESKTIIKKSPKKDNIFRYFNIIVLIAEVWYNNV